MVSQEDLMALLEQDITSWQTACNPIMEAYEFDPTNQDPTQLELYNQNTDDWIAGVQVKKLSEYLATIKDAEPVKL